MGDRYKHAVFAKRLIWLLDSVPQVDSGCGSGQQHNEQNYEEGFHLRTLHLVLLCQLITQNHSGGDRVYRRFFFIHLFLLL